MMNEFILKAYVKATTLNFHKANQPKKGQSLAEYGLILALIAIVCIASLTFLGGEIDTALRAIGGALTGAVNGGVAAGGAGP